MYFRSFGHDRGRRTREVERTDEKNENLLRLALGAVEIVSTRREVLDAVNTARSSRLPDDLLGQWRAIDEPAVVFEFAQLARQDFERNRNEAVWERGVSTGGGRGSTKYIDMALFEIEGKRCRARAVGALRACEELPCPEHPRRETRLEFGKSRANAARDKDEKLNTDAGKLLSISHHTHAEFPEVRNLVLLWHEDLNLKLTEARGNQWWADCVGFAAAASTSTGGTVEVEAVSATTLLRLHRAGPRSAYAALYSVTSRGDGT